MNSNEELVEIIPAFSQSLTTFIDPGLEIIELGIDAILKDGLLKDVPIVGAFTAVLKFGYNIYDRNLLKQTLVFISTMNDGTISEEKLSEYKRKLQEDPKLAEKELGRTVLFLNKHVEYTQSRALARFHQAYVNQEITWEQLSELAVANERMFAGDYQILLELHRTDGVEKYKGEVYQVDRLVSLGLVSKNTMLGGIEVINGGTAVFPERESQENKDILMTSFGKLFCTLLH